MRILNIGPCLHRKTEHMLGGEVVLFENWLEFCASSNIDCLTIDSLKKNYSNVGVAYFSIFLKFLRHIRFVDSVFLHGTLKDYKYLVPVFVFLSFFFHKKIYLRKFAGNFDVEYYKSSLLVRKLLDYSLRHSTLIFWETKKLVYFGKKFNINSYWFPNVRQKCTEKVNFSFKRRFVFISQVRREKGIDILIECFKQLDNSYHLDIYGPLFGYKKEELQGENFNYIGVLEPNQVASTLENYDCLVLPSFREGYPGIIIESFSVGVPIIATRVGGIPELLQDGVNGFLIPPNNTVQLLNVIKNMSNIDFSKLSINAKKSFVQFDSDIVNRKIYSLIKSNTK